MTIISRDFFPELGGEVAETYRRHTGAGTDAERLRAAAALRGARVPVRTVCRLLSLSASQVIRAVELHPSEVVTGTEELLGRVRVAELLAVERLLEALEDDKRAVKVPAWQMGLVVEKLARVRADLDPKTPARRVELDISDGMRAWLERRREVLPDSHSGGIERQPTAGVVVDVAEVGLSPSSSPSGAAGGPASGGDQEEAGGGGLGGAGGRE